MYKTYSVHNKNVKIDILPNDTWLPERALIHQSFRMTVFSCFVIDDKTRISFQYNEKSSSSTTSTWGCFLWIGSCNAMSLKVWYWGHTFIKLHTVITREQLWGKCCFQQFYNIPKGKGHMMTSELIGAP